MTNGEKWLAAAHKRLAGWCTTRGWKYGPPIKLSAGDRQAQYCVFISDRYGTSGEVVFQMYAGEASFVDDYGTCQDDFNAAAFEDHIAKFNLAPKPVVAKRQLCMGFA